MAGDLPMYVTLLPDSSGFEAEVGGEFQPAFCGVQTLTPEHRLAEPGLTSNTNIA
jgi:hypothetical protein